VRRLVRVDGGVLDDRLAGIGGRRPGRRRVQTACEERSSIEVRVQVAVPGGVDARDPWHGRQHLGQLLGDRAGRLPEAPRQLEGYRHRQIAERAIGRVIDHERELRVGSEPVSILQHGGEPRAKRLMNRENHAANLRVSEESGSDLQPAECAPSFGSWTGLHVNAWQARCPPTAP
jgi:hypothetical protein